MVLHKALVVCFGVWVRVCLIHVCLGVLFITQSDNSSYLLYLYPILHKINFLRFLSSFTFFFCNPHHNPGVTSISGETSQEQRVWIDTLYVWKFSNFINWGSTIAWSITTPYHILGSSQTTLLYNHNTIILQNTHKRHCIACPWGQAMECLLWVHSQTYILHMSLSCYM